MAHSGRERHRDRAPGHRALDEIDAGSLHRVFRLTDEDRRDIARCLRAIDEARRAIEEQHNAANRAVVRALRDSADHIFDIIDTLELTAP